jgi:hypothetical protein
MEQSILQRLYALQKLRDDLKNSYAESSVYHSQHDFMQRFDEIDILIGEMLSLCEQLEQSRISNALALL